ncbi:hypothetical protein ACFQY7_17220 [Actinomadura luteofluorescens]|uniref:Uncharacterized protein n=1 Tax=Actinomadura luteofluorescens TaxID=46163 RepID=A0A7Y9EQC9_9ACTN|nr:hypothetical protein [Actinomadura luteofluorescens]NYD51859.1 hypothetical protein [Actinomadura luteofluorescens]
MRLDEARRTGLQSRCWRLFRFRGEGLDVIVEDLPGLLADNEWSQRAPEDLGV